MASCDQISLLLGPFEDGELEPHEMEEVAFHVVNCAPCKSTLEEYRALGVRLRDIATTPPLEGFVRAVVERISPKRTSIRERLSHLPGWLERVATALEVAGVAAVTAVLTILAIPYAQQYLNRAMLTPSASASAGNASMPLAAGRPSVVIAESSPSVELTKGSSQSETPSDENMAARDSQEVVSELGGGDSPAVAVWNEPRTGTTVVWVPDQP